jgi:hypothetical protein
VVTGRRTTEIALFRLVARGNRISYRKVASLSFPDRFRLPNGQQWSPCEDLEELPHLEGLVVDEATITLYAAPEDVGLWRVDQGRDWFSSQPRIVRWTCKVGVPSTVDPATEECRPAGPDQGFGGRIAADVEGRTIYATDRRSGTLLVSSRGASTFAPMTGRRRVPLVISRSSPDPGPTALRTAPTPCRLAARIPERFARRPTATTLRSSPVATANLARTPTSSPSTPGDPPSVTDMRDRRSCAGSTRAWCRPGCFGCLVHGRRRTGGASRVRTGVWRPPGPPLEQPRLTRLPG